MAAKKDPTYCAKLSIEMAKIDTCLALIGQIAGRRFTSHTQPQ